MEAERRSGRGISYLQVSTVWQILSRRPMGSFDKHLNKKMATKMF